LTIRPGPEKQHAEKLWNNSGLFQGKETGAGEEDLLSGKI